MLSKNHRPVALAARSPPRTQHNRALRIIAEVHGFRRHQHPDRSGRDQHSATHAFERQIARNTAFTSRGLAPPGTLTLIIPITISMQAGRRS